MPRTAQNPTVGAFVLNNTATYPWTIYVHVPGEAGRKVKVKFKADFRHVTPERRLEILQEFREALRDRDAGDERAEGMDDVDALKKGLSCERMLLDEVLVGFSGILTPDKQQLPFNDETKDQLLSNSWARDALLAGYHTSLQGRSPEGN